MRKGWGGHRRVRTLGGVLALAMMAAIAGPATAATDKPIAKPLPPPPAVAAPAAAAAPAATPAAPPPAAVQAEPPAAPAVSTAVTDDIARQNALIVSTLIRTTLIALHQANATGNYTVLRDLAAPSFRDKNSAADLANTFASLRDQKVDLSVAAVVEAHLTGAPTLDENRMLRLTGTLPARPNPVSFQLAYQAVDGGWRLSGIAVGPSGPVALALPASAAKPQEANAGASSLMPDIRTIVSDPKAKAAVKPKPKTKTATRETAGASTGTGTPMALIPPAPKARPAKTTAN